MLSLVFAMAYVATAQDHYPARLGDALEHAHIVALAEFLEYEGSYVTSYVDRDYNATVHRYRFRTLSALKGHNLPSTIVMLKDREEVVGRRMDSLEQGGIYVVQGYAPAQDLTVRSGEADIRFALESPDQWLIRDVHNMIKLPPIQYTTAGESVHERYMFVITQAYEAEADSKFLDAIQDAARISPPAERPAAMEQFYGQAIHPRLLVAAGTDPSKRLNALSIGIFMNMPEGEDAYWSYVQQVDQTSEPSERIAFYLPPVNDQKALSLIADSRNVHLRAQAVRWLSRRVSVNRDRVIFLLESPDQPIRAAALFWLAQLAEEGAPILRRGPDGEIRNESELIQYWRGG